MRLEIYRGSVILLGDGSGHEHVGVIDHDREETPVVCLCGPAGDEESEAMARRVKAALELVDGLKTETIEEINKGQSIEAINKERP